MVIDNIVEYMNARSKRKFTRYEGCAIRDSIKIESNERDTRPIGLNTKTKLGRAVISQRTADICKRDYNVSVTAKDVKLYKNCFADEYSDRTGKCAWGFRNKRIDLGYDPETGVEIIN